MRNRKWPQWPQCGVSERAGPRRGADSTAVLSARSTSWIVRLRVLSCAESAAAERGTATGGTRLSSGAHSENCRFLSTPHRTILPPSLSPALHDVVCGSELDGACATGAAGAQTQGNTHCHASETQPQQTNNRHAHSKQRRGHRRSLFSRAISCLLLCCSLPAAARLPPPAQCTRLLI